jgi:hypothetical protein
MTLLTERGRHAKCVLTAPLFRPTIHGYAEMNLEAVDQYPVAEDLAYRDWPDFDIDDIPVVLLLLDGRATAAMIAARLRRRLQQLVDTNQNVRLRTHVDAVILALFVNRPDVAFVDDDPGVAK